MAAGPSLEFFWLIAGGFLQSGIILTLLRSYVYGKKECYNILLSKLRI